jgi:hypothetical protein
MIDSDFMARLIMFRFTAMLEGMDKMISFAIRLLLLRSRSLLLRIEMNGLVCYKNDGMFLKNQNILRPRKPYYLMLGNF